MKSKKKKFVIGIIGYYYDESIPPELMKHRRWYKTEAAALKKAENLCIKECRKLNKNSSGLRFESYVEGESFWFDEATTAWDGEDYRVVTGYKVVAE